MEKLKKLLRPIKRRLEHFIPDSIYLRWQYKNVTGKKLNLKNPQTFNEKLQWLKLHDRTFEIKSTYISKTMSKSHFDLS